MEAYIDSLACISHHPTIDADFFFEETNSIPSSNFLSITAPAYKDFIPTTMIRRTSHILKMGISAGLMSLKASGNKSPDAIVIGTGMGCYEDTDKFLRSIGDNDERMLTPTSFIQSTHNTVSGQIALLVKCHGYNFTYVHQNLSFEYALLDALLLLQEKEAKTVLLGGVDELNPSLCELFERADHIKKKEALQEPIWKSTTAGYVAGEGACFFNLSAEASDKSRTKIKGVKMLQNIRGAEALQQEANTFLETSGLKQEDIHLVLSGINGDAEKDKHLNAFTTAFPASTAYFKHLCGEYFTASAFALWFAARILKEQKVPSCALTGEAAPSHLKNILIVNQYQDQLYSFICVSAC